MHIDSLFLQLSSDVASGHIDTVLGLMPDVSASTTTPSDCCTGPARLVCVCVCVCMLVSEWVCVCMLVSEWVCVCMLVSEWVPELVSACFVISCVHLHRHFEFCLTIAGQKCAVTAVHLPQIISSSLLLLGPSPPLLL